MFATGGLAEEVTEKHIHSAFIPFGDIVDVNLPLDYETEKHRGFAFVGKSVDIKQVQLIQISFASLICYSVNIFPFLIQCCFFEYKMCFFS